MEKYPEVFLQENRARTPKVDGQAGIQIFRVGDFAKRGAGIWFAGAMPGGWRPSQAVGRETKVHRGAFSPRALHGCPAVITGHEALDGGEANASTGGFGGRNSSPRLKPGGGF